MKATLLSTASAMVLVALPQAAVAQDSAASPDDTGLEEIVVTAQRREESAQRAALAVSVVSSEALLSAGVTNATTLNAVAPSLTVSQGGGANSAYFVRGVGNF